MTPDRRSIATGLGALELQTGRTSIFGSAQNLLDRIAVNGFAGLDGKNALVDVIASRLHSTSNKSDTADWGKAIGWFPQSAPLRAAS